jgi:hypothetical protein
MDWFAVACERSRAIRDDRRDLQAAGGGLFDRVEEQPNVAILNWPISSAGTQVRGAQLADHQVDDLVELAGSLRTGGQRCKLHTRGAPIQPAKCRIIEAVA